MSIQDPIAYAGGVRGTTAGDSGFWLSLAAGTGFCFLAVFAWVSGAANMAQIVAAIVVLSLGLGACAVMKIDEIDSHGLEGRPGAIETVTGIAIFAGLTAISLMAASLLFAPLAGLVQFTMFAIAFAAFLGIAVVAEGVLSAAACVIFKPVLAKSAIGPEIAIMLNMQQKYRMRLG